MGPRALIPVGASNLAVIEDTAIPLLQPFAGAGEGAVWKQILGCFPPAGCGDERPDSLLGDGIFISIAQ